MSSQAYGEASYWDERYRKESHPFDWYQTYDALLPLLRLHLLPHHRVLLPGCGNSRFGERMIEDGFKEVINVDISSVLIESMQNKYKDIPQLKYMKMDVRDMKQFENRSFDAIIDKGTLDSIMCGQDSQENAKKMLEEVFRVLKQNGVYIMITYGDPSYRLRLLKDIKLWQIKMHVIDRFVENKMWDITKELALNESLGPKPDVHYIYICTKDESLREDEY